MKLPHNFIVFSSTTISNSLRPFHRRTHCVVKELANQKRAEVNATCLGVALITRYAPITHLLSFRPISARVLLFRVAMAPALPTDDAIA